MYNSNLNKKWTDDFINYCSDKSVIVVGNSLSLFGDTYGDLINSYDVIVRMGRGYPEPEFEKFIGNRTDCWIFSSLRTGMYKKFDRCPFRIFNLSQFFIYDENYQFLHIDKHQFFDDFQVYKDYFMMGNIDQIKRLIEVAGLGQRASQGAVALSYFVNVIQSYKKLDIIGFDFFEATVNYELYKNVHTVSSYHLPVPTSKVNPHFDTKVDTVNKEKAYISSLENSKKISIHKMDKYPSKDALDMLFLKFRPQAKHRGETNE